MEAIAPNELEQHRRKRSDLETRLFQKQEGKIADQRQSAICLLPSGGTRMELRTLYEHAVFVAWIRDQTPFSQLVSRVRIGHAPNLLDIDLGYGPAKQDRSRATGRDLLVMA